MDFFREIADFYRFFWATPNAQKQIVFYAEHKDYYPYFEGLIREITPHQPLCYVTSDLHDPILKPPPPPGLTPFYIHRLLSFFMLFVSCKVFVMTLTDLHQFHLKRSVNAVHYVYVFHSMVSTHMMYREGAFDHYDSILCVGPYQISEIRARENRHHLPPKKLVEAGYYRLERIHQRYQAHIKEETPPGNKTTVLIAPSWGEHNILETCGGRLVSPLLEKGYQIIVRPHPETVRRSPQMLNALEQMFSGNTHFRMERSVASDDALLTAGVLICDLSGVALEYALGTQRPVLFLDLPFKIKNPNFRELGIDPVEVSLRAQIGIIVPPEELDRVPQVIEQLHADQKKYAGQILRWRDENIFAFEHSSKSGADHILGLADAQRTTK